MTPQACYTVRPEGHPHDGPEQWHSRNGTPASWDTATAHATQASADGRNWVIRYQQRGHEQVVATVTAGHVAYPHQPSPPATPRKGAPMNLDPERDNDGALPQRFGQGSPSAQLPRRKPDPAVMAAVGRYRGILLQRRRTDQAEADLHRRVAQLTAEQHAEYAQLTTAIDARQAEADRRRQARGY